MASSTEKGFTKLQENRNISRVHKLDQEPSACSNISTHGLTLIPDKKHR